MTQHSALQIELADIVGAGNVLSGAEDTKPYLTDWRRQYTGTAECIVRPAGTAEVAEVVKRCAARGVAIVPQGGNTGLSGGSIPAVLPDAGRPQIVLSLSR